MIDVWNSINNYIQKYQKSLLFIVILFGGSYQFLQLFLINPSFIRFFSVTQLVADGIATGMFLIISFVYLFLIWTRFKKLQQNYFPKNAIWSIILIYSAGAIYLANKIFWPNYSIFEFTFWLQNFSHESSWYIITLYIGISALISYVLLPHVVLIFIEMKRGTPTENKMEIRKSIKGIKGKFLLALALLLTIPFIPSFFLASCNSLYSLSMSVYKIHNEYNNPSNFGNIEALRQVIQENSDSTKITIRYFNDQYVFVDIDNQIFVLKNSTLITESLDMTKRYSEKHVKNM